MALVTIVHSKGEEETPEESTAQKAA